MDIRGARSLLTTAAKSLYLRILAGERPTRRDHAALALLVEADLIAPKLSADGEYDALSPDVAARNRQTALQLAATRSLSEAQLIPSQFQELAAAYQLAHPTRSGGGVEMIEGFPEINERLEVLVNSCETELITAHPTGPRPAHVLAVSYKRDLGVLDRGAKIRTLYLPSVRQDAPTGRWAATMTQYGAQIRTSNDFGRAIIVDRRAAVTSVLPASGVEERGTEPRALFVTDEYLVRTLAASFERDWRRAEPWDGTVDAPGPTERHRELLALLAKGVEVQAAAEKLGISPRTAATRLAELRAMAGAKNQAELLYWWGRQEFQV